MSNPGEADLVDLVDALQEAVMAYGRHLVAKKKSIDDVKALMYEKLDYAIVSLQRQNTSTAGAPSRLPLDAGLELCQESDPRGTMIHWKWFTDPPAHQSRPCHHLHSDRSPNTWIAIAWVLALVRPRELE